MKFLDQARRISRHRVRHWFWIASLPVVLGILAYALMWYGSQPQSRLIRGQVDGRSPIAYFGTNEPYASYFSYFPLWTNVLQIGDSQRAIPTDMYVELYGELLLSSPPESTSDTFIGAISGEATSVRLNGEEQLPARWPATDDLPNVVVTAVITSVISGLVVTVIGLLIDQQRAT